MADSGSPRAVVHRAAAQRRRRAQVREMAAALALALLFMAACVGVSTRVAFVDFADFRHQVGRVFDLALERISLEPAGPRLAIDGVDPADAAVVTGGDAQTAPWASPLGKPDSDNPKNERPRDFAELPVAAPPDFRPDALAAGSLPPEGLPDAPENVGGLAGLPPGLQAELSRTPPGGETAPRLPDAAKPRPVGDLAPAGAGLARARPGRPLPAGRLEGREPRPAWTPPAPPPPPAADAFAPGLLENAPLPPEPSTPAFRVTAAVGDIARRLAAERPAGGYPSLNRDLSAVFTVAPAPPGEAPYFRLDLDVRPESPLPRLPKDVLVCVDVSRSIPEWELEQARLALRGYLADAARDNAAKTPERADRINFAVFSERARFLDPDGFPAPGAVDPAALDGLLRHPPDETLTNVYQIVKDVLVRAPGVAARPVNVFLVTDGEASSGPADARRIVHDIRRVDREQYSLFTFNGGHRGDHYLLTLLAYRSRGVFDYHPETRGYAAALADFMRRYDEPVLTNVVAAYTGFSGEDTFPEALPNLYRGVPLRFWGRAMPGAEVIVRVAGVGADGPREFFFKATMPRAEAASGAESSPIAREWALGKAHALLAEQVDAPDAARAAALSELARRYGLDDMARFLSREGLSTN